jgi:protein translocase SecG subunit
MNAMITVILAVQMLSALAMIGLILVQQGKGADMGAAFGSGNSGSLFGASGGANFLSRTIFCNHFAVGLFWQLASGIFRQRFRG